MEFGPISQKVLGCALEVHRTLGPGLLETVYEKALAQELTDAGLQFAAQVQLPVIYKGHDLGCGFRIDLLVENSVVVELKTVDQLAPIHEAQLITYLKLSGRPHRPADQLQRSAAETRRQTPRPLIRTFVSSCLRG